MPTRPSGEPSLGDRGGGQSSVRALLAALCVLGGGERALAAPRVGPGELAYQHGDFRQARRLLLPAARAGDARAELLLGDIAALRGDSGAGAAARWYRLAADKGLAAAQAKLAVCYVDGSGVPQSNAKAVSWYRRAARQGEVQAAASLAYFYFVGDGVPRDYAQAAHWYRVAAERGDAMSQTMLGDLYTSGVGVPHSPRQAAEWYRRAAEQDDPQGQYKMAVAYSEGAGVPRDVAAAFVWITLALDNQSEKRVEREPATRLAAALAGELTKAQSDETQRRIAAWRPSPGVAHEFEAPDGTLRAVVAADGHGESRVEIRMGARLLVRRSYGSADGSHGFVVEHAEWTPDSRFFVFSLTSSGGHQPWRYPAFFYSRRTNGLVALDERIGALADPNFQLSAPDELAAKVTNGTGPAVAVRANLGKLPAARP